MRRMLLSLAVATLALVGAGSALASDPEPVVADGVTIAGQDVAGLTKHEAKRAARAWFARRVVVRLGRRQMRANPYTDLRGRAFAGRAADAAIVAAPGTTVPLRVMLRKGGIRTWVERVAKRFNKRPKNARLVLRGLRPYVTKHRKGIRIKQGKLRDVVRWVVKTHRRDPVTVRYRVLRPAVKRSSFGPSVVIRRDSKRLYLYRRNRLRATFGVAVGLPQYPTPLGRFRIVTMQRNPWWYPPSAGWAAGAQPIPPGPGNPLGTRWMGLSVGAVGIHGTPDAASIGYSASHGCIRMRISDAERLFERVRLGSTVFIVGA